MEFSSAGVGFAEIGYPEIGPAEVGFADELGGHLTLAFVVDKEPGDCSPYGTKYLLSFLLKLTAQ